jgi:hypothetical protein
MDDDVKDHAKETLPAGEATGAGDDAPRVLSVGSPGGRRRFLTAAAAAGAAAASCSKDSPSGPSSRGGGSAASTTSATTSSVQATFTLSGRVTDRSGRPVVGARITIVSVDSNNGKSATTDSDGRYSISGLVAGGFTLQTIHNGVDLFSQGVTLLGNMTLNYSVTTTSTSTTSRATTSTASSTTSTGGTSHYWYPN